VNCLSLSVDQDLEIDDKQMLRIGLIINPLAGLGGPAGLKGSDGAEIVAQALEKGVEQRAMQRTLRALKVLQEASDEIRLLACPGVMGGDAVAGLGFETEFLNLPMNATSGAKDTRAAAELMRGHVDLLVFTGGDGTARDILDVLGESTPVLGIPSGVKMHSGVYAVSPEAAGELLLRLARSQLVSLQLADVRDIDEEAFREGTVKSRYYGQMQVPAEAGFLQQVKVGGRESEPLVLLDIAAQVEEMLEDDELAVLGPGSTLEAVKLELGLDATLLGVDVSLAGEQLGKDMDEAQLFALISEHEGPVRIFVTAIGGQGHIIGRGNQQISPRCLRAAGIENLQVLATKTKISGLQQRPLLVDSNDPELDSALRGFRTVITGYQDQIYYPVA
jgi:predicted polyphosphate/ATP-dependent NAD kinase